MFNSKCVCIYVTFAGHIDQIALIGAIGGSRSKYAYNLKTTMA